MRGLLILAAMTFWSAVSHAAEIKNVRLGVHSDKTRLVLDMNQSPRFKVLGADEKGNLQVLISNASAGGKSSSGRGRIAKYAIMPAEGGGQLLIIKPSKPSKIGKIFAIQSPHRLVIDIKAGTQRKIPKPVVKAVKQAAPAETSVVSADPIPAILPARKRIIDVSDDEDIDSAAEAGTTIEEIPEITMIPVAKPARHVIVIDPGHGGKDPGTIGARGVMEKNVTLLMALELKRELDATGKYDVYLTRKHDEFMQLRQRFAVAREVRADLFISLHADSHPDPKMRGMSVYTLSDHASDKEAARLAKKENKANIIKGVDLEDEPEEVSSILLNLSQRTTMNHSALFAKQLIKSISAVEKTVPNSHRSADLAVLKAPDVVSVLIELGYLSNKQDRKRLVEKRYQKRLASRIVDAIGEYFKQF
ncbi:MAG: N-acetylmuramoyl-L-alanine amidase family protein [Alphaproteobacteria bacterium]